MKQYFLANIHITERNKTQYPQNVYIYLPYAHYISLPAQQKQLILTWNKTASWAPHISAAMTTVQDDIPLLQYVAMGFWRSIPASWNTVKM